VGTARSVCRGDAGCLPVAALARQRREARSAARRRPEILLDRPYRDRIFEIIFPDHRVQAYCDLQVIAREPSGEPNGVRPALCVMATVKARRRGHGEDAIYSTPRRTGRSEPSPLATAGTGDGSAGRSTGRPSRKSGRSSGNCTLISTPGCGHLPPIPSGLRWTTGWPGFPAGADHQDRARRR